MADVQGALWLAGENEHPLPLRVRGDRRHPVVLDRQGGTDALRKDSLAAWRQAALNGAVWSWREEEGIYAGKMLYGFKASVHALDGKPIDVEPWVVGTSLIHPSMSLELKTGFSLQNKRYQTPLVAADYVRAVHGRELAILQQLLEDMDKDGGDVSCHAEEIEHLTEWMDATMSMDVFNEVDDDGNVISGDMLMFEFADGSHLTVGTKLGVCAEQIVADWTSKTFSYQRVPAPDAYSRA